MHIIRYNRRLFSYRETHKKSNAIFNCQVGTFYKKNTLNTHYFFFRTNQIPIDCTAAFLSNVKYSLAFPPFFLFAFVAKLIFLLSDIMATADFLLKQSTTNNRHVHTHIFNWQVGTFYKKKYVKNTFFFF
jgi:hypothetical protein